MPTSTAMLALNPGLMASMDDAHFLSALECEPTLMRTEVELSLMARLEAAIDRDVNVEMIRTKVTEALCGYPDEDCLSDLINHDDLPSTMFELLANREVEITQSGEYARKELEEVLDHLEHK